mgnify:CR=1 FL=1
MPDGRRVTVAGLVLVRQRPGKGNAIFLTLEDEGGIANIIIWARSFDRFRPIVMGGRFIRVTGKLQSEMGVVHIVAEKMEDLTGWLADLSEKAVEIDTLSRADAPTRGGSDPRERPHGNTPTPHSVNAEELAEAARQVMPKGRNFH